jgi:hypothetical protein
MIHKKSCLGRTFEQDTQASDPDGKSWSDDKFYENLRFKKKTAQAQQGQEKKQGVIMSALGDAFKILYHLNSDLDDPDLWSSNHTDYFDIINDPCYSSVPGNIFYTD